MHFFCRGAEVAAQEASEEFDRVFRSGIRIYPNSDLYDRPVLCCSSSQL